MGGERETVLEKSSQTGDVTISQKKGCSIRLHQSGGFIHFHDDNPERKLKCAVPVAIWWKAWERLRSVNPEELQKFYFADVNEKTVLEIQTSCVLGTDGYQYNTTIDVEPCKADKNYTELAKFTQGR